MNDIRNIIPFKPNVLHPVKTAFLDVLRERLQAFRAMIASMINQPIIAAIYKLPASRQSIFI
jgi:hypothetical protein